ncbi:hypothetical protein RFI_38186, partial [Reticulomyxa filosa]
EHLGMTREVTIDKENLDYLNHYETFYIYNMTDNLQYWMIVVEKELCIVRCKNGRLSLPNTLSSLQFFKITHHNIASICLDTAKSLIIHITDVNIMSSDESSNKGSHYKFFLKQILHGHDFLIKDVLIYGGELLTNETLSPTVNCEEIQGIENAITSKFAFDFGGKHYSKNVVATDERENRYLEKSREGLIFFKEKGKYCFVET